MSNLKFCAVMLVLLLLAACKKESTDVFPEEQALAYADSLSFEIDGKAYSFDERNSSGFGNSQVNIKPYSDTISGQKWAYRTGNRYWYGENDSTLYYILYELGSQKETGSAKISFSKKFHNDQLRKSKSTLSIPSDHLGILKEGRQTFAVDFGMENTTEGVALEVHLAELPSALTSYRPGFSIVVRPDLDMSMQKNSSFEIIKVQRIDDNLMFVQAKFALNLFDAEGKLYRLENGYAEFRAAIKLNGGFIEVP